MRNHLLTDTCAVSLPVMTVDTMRVALTLTTFNCVKVYLTLVTCTVMYKVCINLSTYNTTFGRSQAGLRRGHVLLLRLVIPNLNLEGKQTLPVRFYPLMFWGQLI